MIQYNVANDQTIDFFIESIKIKWTRRNNRQQTQ